MAMESGGSRRPSAYRRPSIEGLDHSASMTSVNDDRTSMSSARRASHIRSSIRRASQDMSEPDASMSAVVTSVPALVPFLDFGDLGQVPGAGDSLRAAKGQLEKHLALCQKDHQTEKDKNVEMQALVDQFLSTFLTWTKGLHSSLLGAQSLVVHNEVHASEVLCDLIEWLATKSCADWNVALPPGELATGSMDLAVARANARNNGGGFKRVLESFDTRFQAFLSRPRHQDLDIEQLRQQFKDTVTELENRQKEVGAAQDQAETAKKTLQRALTQGKLAVKMDAVTQTDELQYIPQVHQVQQQLPPAISISSHSPQKRASTSANTHNTTFNNNVANTNMGSSTKPMNAQRVLAENTSGPSSPRSNATPQSPVNKNNFAMAARAAHRKSRESLKISKDDSEGQDTNDILAENNTNTGLALPQNTLNGEASMNLPTSSKKERVSAIPTTNNLETNNLDSPSNNNTNGSASMGFKGVGAVRKSSSEAPSSGKTVPPVGAFGAGLPDAPTGPVLKPGLKSRPQPIATSNFSTPAQDIFFNTSSNGKSNDATVSNNTAHVDSTPQVTSSSIHQGQSQQESNTTRESAVKRNLVEDMPGNSYFDAALALQNFNNTNFEQEQQEQEEEAVEVESQADTLKTDTSSENVIETSFTLTTTFFGIFVLYYCMFLL